MRGALRPRCGSRSNSLAVSFKRGVCGCLIVAATLLFTLQAQTRYAIADQDATGPGGSDMRALMVFLQAPEVKLLGITVVVGDGWRDEEVAHALRLLEILGRTGNLWGRGARLGYLFSAEFKLPGGPKSVQYSIQVRHNWYPHHCWHFPILTKHNRVRQIGGHPTQGGVCRNH